MKFIGYTLLPNCTINRNVCSDVVLVLKMYVPRSRSCLVAKLYHITTLQRLRLCTELEAGNKCETLVIIDINVRN